MSLTLLLALAACSSSPDALIEQGKVAAENGDFEQALALYGQALEAGAEQANVVYGATWGQAQVYQSQKNYAEQIKLLDGILGNEALKAHYEITEKKLIEAYMMQGAALSESNPEGSDKAYRKAIEHGSTKARNVLAAQIVSRASGLQKAKKFQEAVKLYQSAIELKPTGKPLEEATNSLLVCRRQLFQAPFLAKLARRLEQLKGSGQYDAEKQSFIFNVKVQVVTDKRVSRRTKGAAAEAGEKLAITAVNEAARALAKELGAGDGAATLPAEKIQALSSKLGRRSKRNAARKYETPFELKAGISRKDFLHLAWLMSK